MYAHCTTDKLNHFELLPYNLSDNTPVGIKIPVNRDFLDRGLGLLLRMNLLN